MKNHFSPSAVHVLHYSKILIRKK